MNKHVINLKCRQCGEYFTATRADAKTCTPMCRKQYSKHSPIKIKSEAAPLHRDELVGQTHIREDGLIELSREDMAAIFAGTLDLSSIPDPYLKRQPNFL